MKKYLIIFKKENSIPTNISADRIKVDNNTVFFLMEHKREESANRISIMQSRIIALINLDVIQEIKEIE